MPLTYLPQEVVEKVAEYLSEKDLLACLEVNEDWKNVFNVNRIWIRFITVHPYYFFCQESQLNNFSQPDFDFCNARKLLFVERQVQTKVLCGDYKVTDVNIGATYCDCLVDHIDEVGNHWLFTSCLKSLALQSEHMITVWNLNASPVLHASVETPLGLTRRKVNTKMKMMLTKLFYIGHKVVLVYQFSHPDCELKFLYKVDNSYAKTVISTECCYNRVYSFLYSRHHIENNEAPYLNVHDEKGSLVFQNFDEEVFRRQLEETDFHASPYQTVKAGCTKILVEYGNRDDECVMMGVLDTETMEFFVLDVFFYDPQYINFSYDITEEAAVAVNYIKPEGRLSCSNYSGLSPISDIIVKPYISSLTALLGNDGKDLVVLLGHRVRVFNVLHGLETQSFRIERSRTSVANLWKPNILIHQFSKHKTKIHTSVWDYKDGFKLYNLHLSSEFSYERLLYNFSSVESYSSPPKVVAFTIPCACHHYRDIKSKIKIISFY